MPITPMFSNPLFKYTQDVLKNSIFLSCSNSHNFHLTSHKSHKFNTFVHAIWFAGCTVVPLLRLSHHNKKPFCVAFACSPCDYTVSPGTPASSHSPKTHTVNVFASRCVHKCVCEWMFVFLACMHEWLVQDLCPRLVYAGSNTLLRPWVRD